jgi:hypothetical protein
VKREISTLQNNVKTSKQQKTINSHKSDQEEDEEEDNTEMKRKISEIIDLCNDGEKNNEIICRSIKKI